MRASRSSVVVYGAIFLLLYPSIVGAVQIANLVNQPESDEFPTSCDDSLYKCLLPEYAHLCKLIYLIHYTADLWCIIKFLDDIN